MTHVDDQASLPQNRCAALIAMRRVLRLRRIRLILTDLHGEIERMPALARAIRPLQVARRARIDGVIDRVMAADLIGAPLYWRMAVLGMWPNRLQVMNLASSIAAAVGCRDREAARGKSVTRRS